MLLSKSDVDGGVFSAEAAERRAWDPFGPAGPPGLDAGPRRKPGRLDTTPGRSSPSSTWVGWVVFDDLPSEPSDDDEPSRIFASLVDALVRLVVRCPCPASSTGPSPSGSPAPSSLAIGDVGRGLRPSHRRRGPSSSASPASSPAPRISELTGDVGRAHRPCHHRRQRLVIQRRGRSLLSFYLFFFYS